MDLQNKKIMAFRKVSDGMQIQPSVNRTALQQVLSFITLIHFSFHFILRAKGIEFLYPSFS
jgi:hypothetical protein